jgi:hemerythrin-like domain-containing protein
MPIQIGQAEPGCDDPIGLMTACHRRIERFLETLCYAARQCGGRALAPEEREAIERALRYFREAAPKHTSDEEEDLFPALVATLPEVAAPVERLEADHMRAAALHAEVDCLGEQWVQTGELSETDLGAFRKATAELELLYAGHIQVEEGEVFPRADGALDKNQLEAIGRRMAARRGVPFPEAASR